MQIGDPWKEFFKFKISLSRLTELELCCKEEWRKSLASRFAELVETKLGAWERWFYKSKLPGGPNTNEHYTSQIFICKKKSKTNKNLNYHHSPECLGSDFR
ncbi:hypothetical protein XENOCAPTIV_006180 [Xenoophorus captivus]|uniref:Uncharacterized protein n=1 Tax=Xenoophorus captivus TaxID=1517983 RepID=A0ABV0Q972_9TELE